MSEIEKLTKVRDALYENWAVKVQRGYVYIIKDAWRAYRKADRELRKAIRRGVR